MILILVIIETTMKSEAFSKYKSSKVVISRLSAFEFQKITYLGG